MNDEPELQPIGLFDSGLGGLSVAIEILRLLPDEQVIYFADQAWCPYGERVPALVRERSLVAVDFLVSRGARVLVAACNTVCAVALDDVRERSSVPVIGLEPAIKPAVSLSQTGHIGVLATPHTARSERLNNLVSRFGGSARVEVKPAPALVDLVEAGEVSGPRVDAVLSDLLADWVGSDLDVVVLGCTHYPFLRPAISRLLGPGVQIVDSGEAIARRTRDLTAGRSRPGRGKLVALTSGDQRRFEHSVVALLERDAEIEIEFASPAMV